MSARIVPLEDFTKFGRRWLSTDWQTLEPCLEDDEIVLDFFCGAGGATVGVEEAIGRPIDHAVNHSPTAIAVHTANHGKTKHYTTDVFDIWPQGVCQGKRVGFAWFSPDCTHFSNAKGDVPRDQKIRSLAWIAVRWCRATRPRVFGLENVREFLSWGPLHPHDHPDPKLRGRPIKERKGETFALWKASLEKLGYVVEAKVLDSALFGSLTRRKRLFVIARCDGLPIVWPQPTHGGTGQEPLRAAHECIDWSLPCPSIFTRKKPLAKKTLRRIALGLQRYVIDNPKPFIIRYNGHGNALPLTDPLGTVTAKDRFGLVVPTLVQTGYGERKGQTPRSLDIHDPLGTIVGCGQKHAVIESVLVAAHLVKSFGDPTDPTRTPVLGSELSDPLGTVTARDHHSLAAVTLVKFRGTSDAHPGCAAVDEPLPTVTAAGIHIAEVRAFLEEFAPEKDAQGTLFDPRKGELRNLGLVTIDGVQYQIVDIGLRMLEPHELLRAQFYPFDEGYDLSAAKTKEAKVRMVGNSVPPLMAYLLAAANIPPSRRLDWKEAA